jgi:hypothetical protein
VPDTPDKRTKGHDGRPRSSGRLPANTPTSSPDRTTAYDTIIVESNQRYQTHSTLLAARQSNSARTPTRADLIHDALAENPDGLSSNDVFLWLRANRSYACQEGDEENFKAYVRKALSAHSRKPTPTVSKVDGSGGSHFIWKLARAEGRTPRSCDLTDRSPPAAEGTLEDIRTPVSPQCDLRRAGTRSTTPAAVQGYDKRSDDQLQEPEAGSGEACEEEEETENVVSDTNHNTGDSAHQPPGMFSEPSTTTSPELLVVVQPRTRAPDVIRVEDVTTIPSPGAFGTEEPRKSVDESEEACNSDPEALRHYGQLALDLNRIKTRRDLCKQNIAAGRDALPDIKDMEKDVEQAMQKVAELTSMLEEAHQVATSACSAREATITKMGEIETAEQELEQLVAKHEVLRTELDNFID